MFCFLLWSSCGVWTKMDCVFEYNVCVWVHCLCLNKMFWKKYVYFNFTIQGSIEWTPPRIFPPYLLSIPLISISSSFYLIFYLSHLLPHAHSFHPKGYSHPFTPLTLKSAVMLPLSRLLILLTFMDTISNHFGLVNLLCNRFTIFESMIRRILSIKNNMFGFV